VQSLPAAAFPPGLPAPPDPTGPPLA